MRGTVFVAVTVLALVLVATSPLASGQETAQDVEQEVAQAAAQETQDVAQETQAAAQETQDVAQETQDAAQETQGAAQETQDVAQETLDAAQETQVETQDLAQGVAQVALQDKTQGLAQNVAEETPGTRLLGTIDHALLRAQNNVYKGVKAVGTPMIKFTVDTMPHLLHIFALTQGVVVHPKLAALAKEAVGRMALFAGSAAGQVAVLGSSVLSDVARITGAVLEVQNDFAAKAEKGIEMSGDAVDSLIKVSSVGVDAAAIGLTSLGDTLVASADVNGAMSGASAKMITAIGNRIQKALESAQKAALALASPILGVTAQKDQLTNVASYMQALKSAQKVFERLVNASSKQ